MGAALRVRAPSASEDDGQFQQIAKIKKNTDRNVRPITFRDLAKFVWPHKTDQHLSHLTKYDARTCRRWLCNETEPPAEALSVILREIMVRYGRE